MPAGRPTKYTEEMPKKLLEFFDRPLFEIIKTKQLIKGRLVEVDERVPARLPTLERFAFEAGVHYDTLNEWSKVHPEFSEAYSTAKRLQKDMLMQNGLNGSYNAGYATYLSKCITDLREAPTQTEEKTRLIIEGMDG